MLPIGRSELSTDGRDRAMTQEAAERERIEDQSPAPTKVCPHCGTQSQTTADRCPNCGKGYKKRGLLKGLAIVGGLFLLLIVGCTALLGGAANDVSKEIERGAAQVQSDSGDESAPPEKTAAVGDRLTLTGTTYRVTDVRTASSLGDQSIGTGVTANGVFVIANVELTNRKDEPATILGDALRLISSNGKSYSTSDDALLAVNDQFILEEIQPDVTERGTLVYDVPESAVSGSKLQVKDLFSDSTGQINLGL